MPGAGEGNGDTGAGAPPGAGVGNGVAPGVGGDGIAPGIVGDGIVPGIVGVGDGVAPGRGAPGAGAPGCCCPSAVGTNTNFQSAYFFAPSKSLSRSLKFVTLSGASSDLL